MTVYLSEEEQVQALKRLWDKYGHFILAVVVFSLSAMVGWQYWQRHQIEQDLQASSAFGRLELKISQDSHAKGLEPLAEKIAADFPHTPYAVMSRLVVARLAVEQGDLKKAKARLQTILTERAAPSLKQISRCRLARIALSEKQPKEALDLLSTLDDSSFAAEVNRLKGHAYLALGQHTEASRALSQAWNAMPSTAPAKGLISMQLSAMGEVTPAVSEPSNAHS